jgi:hypothetical protein
LTRLCARPARRGNRSGFGQPSSCNSPRVAPEACHDPSPWRSASRLHSTVPAVTTQSGAVAHPECPGQSELPHVALQEGAARLIRRRHNQQLGCCWRSIARTSSRGRLSGGPARCAWSRPAPPQAAAVAAAGEAHLRSLVHSSKDAIRRRPRGGARPQDPIGAHERRYGPRDHHCGWRCAECSGSGAVAGGGSSSSGCHSSFWRVRLGRDEHRIAVAARGAGAEQLGGAAGAAGRAYLPAWPSSCCGSLSICSKVRSLSHLLTFAHFLLTFGSRFAEFLLNLAHICTFFCPFSAHFLLIFCSLSPHCLLTFRLVLARYVNSNHCSNNTGTASEGKYRSNMPLPVADRSSLADPTACEYSGHRHYHHNNP